ncbi:AMSH-like ubiquitin thioesterase 3 isoform X1 [Rhododendron vialii]|uniref:AMSH-like ubiquitin thioesterase 3 isoform X1 n=1 Tax=Rhododendron vialii TaxID=182163 RepID=UPI00265E46A4|nr:AMSH-like ubiquitin thioesterase 3 isoform X1 [Rhododendron vialii]
MRPPAPINLNVVARRVDVDNRFPLRHYYRIADSLLKQASIYREEKNIIDLYVMLLRYSSLVSETIPFHRDYPVLLPRERAFYTKKLSVVLDELESLKPKFQRLLNERNKAHAGTQDYQLDTQGRISYGLQESPSDRKASLSLNDKQLVRQAPSSSWKQNNGDTKFLPTNSIDAQLQKPSLNVPMPKKETLSRHSLLGPNGLQGQWLGPSPEIKVHYPSHADVAPNENSGLNQASQYDIVAFKDGEPGVDKSTMESLLSLDDGRWLQPSDDSCSHLTNEASNGPFVLGNIRQPSPPPVLAQVQPKLLPISPSRVADPRPGPAKPLQDGMHSSNSFQHLHIPVKMMEDFLRLARENTAKNLETCGVLAGSLKNRMFHISTLIIPKQESTSDSCQTLNEEEIFEIQDTRSLFQLGWIHTHPSQTCFMSSVDLHTHYSYQVMLPEAIAIVMAPTDTSSPHGIFHLSDPSGVSVIRNCQQRGFHPHEEAEDGSPIYEHCSHVYMNERMKFDVVDLR